MDPGTKPLTGGLGKKCAFRFSMMWTGGIVIIVSYLGLSFMANYPLLYQLSGYTLIGGVMMCVGGGVLLSYSVIS